MSLAHQHVTWCTGHLGDTVKVYATAEPDSDGAVAIRWHWRRLHSSGRVLARSGEPKKRRRDALWEARRISPPLDETDDLRDRMLSLAAQLEGYAREDAEDANDKRLPERRRWYRIGCADSYQRATDLLRQALSGAA